MDYSIYIIKPNTPESNLLHHAGIDRNDLKVTKWHGRKRRNGGFGQNPCEWKVTGVNQVKILCETIVRILEKRKSSLNDEEQRAFQRAKTTLKGIDILSREQEKESEIEALKYDRIETVLLSNYPSINIHKVSRISEMISKRNYASYDDLIKDVKINLYEIAAIEEARRLFFTD